MKRISCLLAILLVPAALLAQEEVKTGYNFGPLPAVSYSSDLGFQYGALTDIYYYGDGSVYPDYVYKLNFEASAYTKGNRTLHAYFDSKHLIPGVRLSAGLSYFGNKTYSFYGFNGAASPFYSELEGINDGFGHYLMERNVLRAMTTLQGTFGDSHWGWAGGLTYWDIRTGDAVNDAITSNLSLYSLYKTAGIIPQDEADGGRHLEFKAGVSYDTRDHENNPTRGTSLELCAYGSPDLFQGRNSYLKLSAHLKQFVPLVADKLVLAGHIAYQGTLAGNTPFYMLPIIQNLNLKQINPEGLGSCTTVRGTLRNRLLGEGYAWTNIELRYTFARFQAIGQYWRLAVNPFFDTGMVVQSYRLDKMRSPDPLYAGFYLLNINNRFTLYTGENEVLHSSAGAGLHIIMNQNFNLSVEFAKCFREQDGNTGLSIELGYIF